MVAHFERELLEHRKDPPEKGARSRVIHEYCKKETFLKFEVSWFQKLVFKQKLYAELF
jgi:hypothetical protein